MDQEEGRLEFGARTWKLESGKWAILLGWYPVPEILRTLACVFDRPCDDGPVRLFLFTERKIVQLNFFNGDLKADSRERLCS
jgi:hypothetical protein